MVATCVATVLFRFKGSEISRAASRSYEQYHGIRASVRRSLYRIGTSRLLRARIKLVLLVDTKDGTHDLDARHEDKRGSFDVGMRRGLHVDCSCFNDRNIFRRANGLTISGCIPSGSVKVRIRPTCGSHLHGCSRSRFHKNGDTIMRYIAGCFAQGHQSLAHEATKQFFLNIHMRRQGYTTVFEFPLQSTATP